MARQFDEKPFRKLHRPTQKELAELAKALKLDQQQLWELERCVNSAVDHCERYHQYRVNTPGRAACRDKAETIRTLLAQLEKEIALGRDAVSAIGLPENMGVIGQLLSFQAVAAVAGNQKVDCLVRPELDKLEHPRRRPDKPQPEEPETVSLLQLEWELVDRKRMVDADMRPDLLLHIIRTMQQQFAPSLEQGGGDVGGAPARAARQIMLHALASCTRRILGKPISKTGGRGFIELCHQVFDICNIDTRGLEEAIRNYLKKPVVWAEMCHWNEIEG